jgi:hypothetical protein
MIAVFFDRETDLGSQRVVLASPSILPASTTYGAPARVTLELPEDGANTAGRWPGAVRAP